jgi:small subunit ribosomal protein S2
MRAINLYCDLVSSAVLSGIQAELMASGVDVGEAEEVAEELPTEEEVFEAVAPEAEQEVQPSA